MILTVIPIFRIAYTTGYKTEPKINTRTVNSCCKGFVLTADESRCIRKYYYFFLNIKLHKDKNTFNIKLHLATSTSLFYLFLLSLIFVGL